MKFKIGQYVTACGDRFALTKGKAYKILDVSDYAIKVYDNREPFWYDKSAFNLKGIQPNGERYV